MSNFQFIYAKHKIHPKINITKWPYGKHYYAKVGNHTVIVSGIAKWNTYEQALKNAKYFKGQL